MLNVWRYSNIENTHNKSNKIFDVHLSDVQRLIKNGQKSDSLASHY